MTDAELDLSYTALCNALAAVGPQRSELMLSMVCVALMARSDQAAPVLELIARSQQRLQDEPADG